MENEIPEFFSFADQYAAYHPVGEMSFEQAIELIDNAIRYCRQAGIGKLLVDVTALTGFPPPSTTQRFTFAKMWAETAGGALVVSMIAPLEMIDPDKIGVTMSANRGLTGNGSTCESEAIRWLLSQPTR